MPPASFPPIPIPISRRQTNSSRPETTRPPNPPTSRSSATESFPPSSISISAPPAIAPAKVERACSGCAGPSSSLHRWRRCAKASPFSRPASVTSSLPNRNPPASSPRSPPDSERGPCPFACGSPPLPSRAGSSLPVSGAAGPVWWCWAYSCYSSRLLPITSRAIAKRGLPSRISPPSPRLMRRPSPHPPPMRKRSSTCRRVPRCASSSGPTNGPMSKSPATCGAGFAVI